MNKNQNKTQKFDTPETTVRVTYELTFGPKDESEREKATYDDEDRAVEVFKKKEKAGLYVDVYQITTTVTVAKKKLST